MSNELIINFRPYETRVALMENGALAELYIERKSDRVLRGNIYRGRVVRVLPGMQAAFVDIGLERTGFLCSQDVVCDLTGKGGVITGSSHESVHGDSVKRSSSHAGIPQIEDVLFEGQEIMVQVSKEPLGKKGARLTCRISIPGRYLVFLPCIDHIGISRKISSQKERERLKGIVEDLRTDKNGFIIRTVSEGVSEEKLRSEIFFLEKFWANIQSGMSKGTGPALLFRELSISLKAVRDLFTKDVDRLVVDSEEEHKKIVEFIRTVSPALEHKVELYDSSEPIFDYFGIEMDIARGLNKKIWLKSGGYIVIEYTEALTAIDVNTGGYVGKSNLEETFLKTNLEAIKEIAYQLRLRDIGGIIIIDFIDMKREADRKKVFNVLKETLSRDRASTTIYPISELGLVEMTRKRTKPNLGRLLTEQCPFCDGMGRIKSMQTITYEIFREVEREHAMFSEDKGIKILVNPMVKAVMMEEEQKSIMDLEERLNTRIIVEPRDDFYVEQYEIVQG